MACITVKRQSRGPHRYLGRRKEAREGAKMKARQAEEEEEEEKERNKDAMETIERPRALKKEVSSTRNSMKYVDSGKVQPQNVPDFALLVLRGCDFFF